MINLYFLLKSYAPIDIPNSVAALSHSQLHSFQDNIKPQRSQPPHHDFRLLPRTLLHVRKVPNPSDGSLHLAAHHQQLVTIQLQSNLYHLILFR